MNKSEQIVAYVVQHPRATNKEISEATGIGIEYTTNRTKILADMGRLERTEISKTLTNKPIYGYSAATTPPKETPVGNVTHTVGKGLDSLLQDFVAGFAKQLASAITSQLKPQLERELRAALPTALPAIPEISREPQYIPASEPEPTPAAPKGRLPVVGIVGIHPPKRGPITNEFGDIFEFVFWCTEDKEHLLRSMAHRCEIIYVMDYVSHKHTQLLSSRGANLRRVHGDILRLCEMLTSHYVLSNAEA